MRNIVYITALCLLAAACGIKKPLVLPGHEKNAPAAAQQQQAQPQPAPGTTQQ